METKNIPNNENRGLGFIKSLYMQPLAPASAEFDFQNNKNELNAPKGNNIICTIIMNGEIYYGRETAQNQLEFSNIKKTKGLSLEINNTQSTEDSVLLSLFICNIVVYKTAYSPPLSK